jgi:hypothetical protein
LIHKRNNKTCRYPAALESRIYPDKSECIQIHPGYIRIYPDTSEYIWDVFGYTRDISGYIRDVSISGYIWIYLDISGIPRLGGKQDI